MNKEKSFIIKWLLQTLHLISCQIEIHQEWRQTNSLGFKLFLQTWEFLSPSLYDVVECECKDIRFFSSLNKSTTKRSILFATRKWFVLMCCNKDYDKVSLTFIRYFPWTMYANIWSRVNFCINVIVNFYKQFKLINYNAKVHKDRWFQRY